MAVIDRRDYVASGTQRDVNIFPATATVIPTRLRKVSWGAIFAGIVIALVTMLALNMLGLAIGAATINPASEIDPVTPALGTATVIWFAATNLLALFAGGFVAGHLSGFYENVDGLMHGLVTWAVTSLLVLFMLTTSVGNIISGVTNAASQALSAAGQVAPEVADALNLQGLTLQGIRDEINSLTTEASTVDAPAGDGMEAGAAQANGDMGTSNAMTLDGIEINRAWMSYFSTSPEERSNADLVTLLTERTNLTEVQAQEMVARWEQTFEMVREDAEAAARRASQIAADTVTVLAGAIFAAMIVGAFAAGAGGIVGAPEPDFSRKDEDDEVVMTSAG